MAHSVPAGISDNQPEIIDGIGYTGVEATGRTEAIWNFAVPLERLRIRVPITIGSTIASNDIATIVDRFCSAFLVAVAEFSEVNCDGTGPLNCMLDRWNPAASRGIG